MRIATFNINGIKARLPRLLEWLDETRPDIACLQEIKTSDDTFPIKDIEEVGYGAIWHGQKGFNGVAILSKTKPDEVTRGLPGDPLDEQARFLEAVFSIPGNRVARVCCLYLPNGNPVETEKYSYKLAWMERLRTFAAERLAYEEILILAGDYNVIPEPHDCFDPKVWENDALFLPQTREAFRRLESLGLTDAVRATTDAVPAYTFWDYQAGAWPKNNGIRIDHLMLSPEAADRMTSTAIEKHVRAWEKPSDHVPVVAYFDFAA